MDEAILFFDEEWYAVHSDKMDVHEISRSADEMITSYQTLALELLERFEKKNDGQIKNLVFFLKSIPSISAAQKMPALRNGSKSIASPLISSASSAFSFLGLEAKNHRIPPVVSHRICKSSYNSLFFFL